MTPEEQAAADAVANTLTGVHFEYTSAGLFGKEIVRDAPDLYVIYHKGRVYNFPVDRGRLVVGYLYDSTGVLRLVYENEPIPAGVIVNSPF